ncbi:MAG: methyltransferase domain-containing protein [Acidimicrobiales bacterium]|nr:MAG: methyltransferase domain-containing protein [Acidimicrobiales bacterium]
MNMNSPLESQSAAKINTNDNCPCCGSSDIKPFYSAPNVPTNSCLLFDSREEALACPTGDIVLGFCQSCGFVYNTKFDLANTEYSGRYEETQGFSPTFSRFHTQLAQDLIDRHNLHGKKVMELGCGKGEFLVLLSQLGQNFGIGIDPSALSERLEGVEGAERVRLIPEYYHESHGAEDVDMLVCKMTLEHIPDAEVFLNLVRANLGDQTDTLVFFQIPEALRILKIAAFEDIYYEHCAYFTTGSLGRLFRRCGFDVVKLDTEYDDQYLTIEAKPAAGEPSPPLAVEDDMEQLVDLVGTFDDRVDDIRDKWKSVVRDAKSAGKSVLLWGSGSKAVSFLTTLGLGDDVEYVTDINPHRANYYMPVTGQRIVPPSELPEIKPDLVIIMNRIYEKEITADLNAMGLHPEIKCL